MNEPSEKELYNRVFSSQKPIGNTALDDLLQAVQTFVKSSMTLRMLDDSKINEINSRLARLEGVTK